MIEVVSYIITRVNGVWKVWPAPWSFRLIPDIPGEPIAQGEDLKEVLIIASGKIKE